MKRAIVRYALCCKNLPPATAFLKKRRTAEAEMVKEVEEGLQYEKGKKPRTAHGSYFFSSIAVWMPHRSSPPLPPGRSEAK